MDTDKLNQASADKAEEAVYLVDRSVLLHLKEVQNGDYDYAVFDEQTKEKVAEGRISEDEVLEGIDPTHDYLASARDAAIGAFGIGGIEVAQVGLTSLKNCPASDIRRRGIWEPETLPKNDIRFIDSHYSEQFRIPDGGTIQVEYPNRVVSVRCEYQDDYHTCIGAEMYHTYQFAAALERNGGVCRPEPVLDADRAAWQIGVSAYLAVECCAGNWDYKLMDDKFNEIKSGELEAVGLSINEVRDLILVENKMERRHMIPTDYGLLMEKAAQKQSEQTAAKPSIKAQLSVKPVPGDNPAAKSKERNAR